MDLPLPEVNALNSLSRVSATSKLTAAGAVASAEPGSASDLPMRDFAHSLPMALLAAREAVMAGFRPDLEAHQLTEQQSVMSKL